MCFFFFFNALLFCALRPLASGNLTPARGLRKGKKKEYFLSGGQPGQKNAWESDSNNLVTNGFFKNTRATIDHAYLRPRFPGWNVFQEKCGALIHAGVKSMKAPCNMAEEIQSVFQAHIG